MSRTSAFGCVARMVLISGSRTGFTPPPRCAPSLDRRRRTAAADAAPADADPADSAAAALRGARDLPARLAVPGLRGRARGPGAAAPAPVRAAVPSPAG